LVRRKYHIAVPIRLVPFHIISRRVSRFVRIPGIDIKEKLLLVVEASLQWHFFSGKDLIHYRFHDRGSVLFGVRAMLVI